MLDTIDRAFATHGLYLVFMAAVLGVVLAATAQAIVDGYRDRRRRRRAQLLRLMADHADGTR